MSHTLDIEAIIARKRLITHFQPLVSARRGMVIGFEALSRGLGDTDNATISPDTLFALAAMRGMNLQLDRACRETAFATFAAMHAGHREALLFLNVDASVLTEAVVGSGHIASLAQRHGVPPANVVLEIIESHVQDTAALMRFIHRYREQGFLIALDDVGAGHSNLERIASIKPEVIKIDRYLISNIHNEFHKQEVVKALAALARRIGAMTVAEGVECREEAVCLMDAGADVLQGFHFARPAPPDRIQDVTAPLQGMIAAYKEHSLERYERMKRSNEEFQELVGRTREHLHGYSMADFTHALLEHLLAFPQLECAYVLSESGVQITDTVCNPFSIQENKRFIYQPARRGTDHSLKEYFLPIQSGLDACMTQPYISQASGNRCITLAARCTSADGVGCVLCLDVMQEERALPMPIREELAKACC